MGLTPAPKGVVFDLDGTLVQSENRNRITAGLGCIGGTTTQPAEALSAADALVADLTHVDWPPQVAA